MPNARAPAIAACIASNAFSAPTPRRPSHRSSAPCPATRTARARGSIAPLRIIATTRGKRLRPCDGTPSRVESAISCAPRRARSGSSPTAASARSSVPANYLNTLGIAAFVLRYRLGPRYHHPIELGDALRAIRTVRARAAEWHIAPDRIGFMGFSAGGHLASSVSTHFDTGKADAADAIDRAGSRPDFAILAYP